MSDPEQQDHKPRQEYAQNEAWTPAIVGTKAFTDPLGNEVYTLSELDDNEIRLATQMLVLGEAFKTDLMKDVVQNLAMLKRSKKRAGERAVISLVRNAGSKVMQTVQQSRFKRIMSNREDYAEND